MKKVLILFCLLFTSVGFSQTEELEHLNIELAFEKTDTTKVNTCLKIIQLLYDAKDFNKALKYIEQSEKLSSELGYDRGLAETLYFKGLIYNEKENYNNAINEYSKSKALFISLKDTLSIAKIDSRLGIIKIKHGNYKSGIKDALSGVRELEKQQPSGELAKAYKNIAKAYQTIDVLDKSIHFYLKSLDIETNLNDIEGTITSNKHLAKLYLRKKEYYKAIKHYKHILDSPKGEDEALRAEILPKLGGIHLETGEYSIAEDYLTEAITLNRELKIDEGIVLSLNNLASLNIQNSKYELANDQLSEAGNIARIINNKEEELKTYLLTKTLDSITGDFKRAYAMQREYHKLKAKIEASKLKEVMTPIKAFDTPTDNVTDHSAIYDSSTQKSAIALANKEKLSRLKLVFYTLLAAFAVALLFFVPIYLKRNNQLKYTQELEAKNQQIKLQNEAILEQSKHLENINNVKDKLFSIVSHDLKDSLTSTKGFIDLLKEGSLSQAEFQSLLPELSENANNASLLLFNLLNWSKSQMQSLEPKPSLFDIQEVFQEKLKLVEQKIQAKKVSLVDNTTRDFVYADRSMVEIIIQNLLANAVKFCRTEDSITVSNSINDDGKTIISVSDSGIGISKENQRKLFNNNTFSTVGTNNEKGTGLGLTICKELVELNKGRIWVDSEIDKGSTFYIELPKNKVGYPILN